MLANYKYSLSAHIWDLPPDEFAGYIKAGWFIQAFFLISIGFTKLSVLLFYRRLVSNTYSYKFKIALWLAMILVFLVTVTFLIILCTLCSPIEAYWRQYDPTYTRSFSCRSVSGQKDTSIVSGTLSVFTDWYSVMLPVTLLWRIKINRRQKIGLAFIFGIGFLVVGAGIVRVVYLCRISGPDIDKTRLAYNAIVAGTAESCVGVACACAPSLKACFRTFFRDNTSKTNSNSSYWRSRSKRDASQTDDELDTMGDGSRIDLTVNQKPDVF